MKINRIGIAGQAGFGVGIAPRLPTGYTALAGTFDVESPEYGNYRYEDGSIMAYVPRFDVAFKEGHPHIVGVDQVAPADSHLVRMPAFFNDGKWRDGFFYDKYLCSNNNCIASSIKGGRVLSSRRRADRARYCAANRCGCCRAGPAASVSSRRAPARSPGDRHAASSRDLRDRTSPVPHRATPRCRRGSAA